MPVKRCTKNGKSGFKWGNMGHCYTGPGAREKAIEQGKAIKMSENARALFYQTLENIINDEADKNKK